MQRKTTWKALDEPAAAYVATLEDPDPLKRANLFIDRGNDAVDDGEFALAEKLFDLAEALLR